MRILLVHNFYGSTAPSGENKVFEAEKAMLEKRGETVEVYTRHSDEIRVAEVRGEKGEGVERVEKSALQLQLSTSTKLKKLYGMVKGAMCTVGNPFAARALRKKIRVFKPDVVHFHNTFPLISPLAIWAAHKSGAKVVMTLHNYRLVCAGGIPMRGGCVCDACFRKAEVKGGGGERRDEPQMTSLCAEFRPIRFAFDPANTRDGKRELSECSASRHDIANSASAVGCIQPGVGRTLFAKSACREATCGKEVRERVERVEKVERLDAEAQRRRAEEKVAEWLAGVDEKSFEAALANLVAEKCAAGEYVFADKNEQVRALDDARKFFLAFSRKMIELSDGRYVYFVPDSRARARGVDNSRAWAEYAFHAVSTGGKQVPGKTYFIRHYSSVKSENIARLEDAIRQERCVAVIEKDRPERDAIHFVGISTREKRFDIVTRLDEYGNVDANLSEVTVVMTKKKYKEKNPPPVFRPLTEVVEAVAKHQAAGFSPSTTEDSLANRATERKGGERVEKVERVERGERVEWGEKGESLGNRKGERGIRKLSVWPAIRGRCYRGSLAATLPLAINIWLYRKCWAKWVDRFIVLSEFQKRIMVACGFPADRISVKGNFVEKLKCEVEVKERRNQVLYVGRLSDEKGIRTLLKAWKRVEKKLKDGVEVEEGKVEKVEKGLREAALQLQLSTSTTLLLVGDGDKRADYERMAEGMNVMFLGQKDHDAVLRLMAESRVTVLPSEWWETFGLTVVESMMVGTPVVVSNLGALPDLAGEGGEKKLKWRVGGGGGEGRDEPQMTSSCADFRPTRFAFDPANARDGKRELADDSASRHDIANSVSAVGCIQPGVGRTQFAKSACREATCGEEFREQAEVGGGGGESCGEVFEAGDAGALAEAIGRMLTREDYEQVCEACRRRVAARYTEEANYRQLIGVYSSRMLNGLISKLTTNS